MSGGAMFFHVIFDGCDLELQDLKTHRFSEIIYFGSRSWIQMSCFFARYEYVLFVSSRKLKSLIFNFPKI